MNVLIIAGGEYVPFNEKFDYVIAADSGYANAIKNNIEPDVVLGDFDSYLDSKSITANKIVFPAEKDDTDLLLAVKEAVKLKPTSVTILSSIGNRQDHNYASYCALLYLKNNNIPAKIIGANTEAFIVKNETVKVSNNKSYKYLSVLSFSEISEGVTLKGFKYPLNNVVLYNFAPIGVSNEITENIAEITVKNGTLLIIRTN